MLKRWKQTIRRVKQSVSEEDDTESQKDKRLRQQQVTAG